MAAMLAARAASKTLIVSGGTTAVHTLGHRSIGGRPSLGSGDGHDPRRGAPVRFGHGRTDHGRYCFAGGGTASSEAGRAASRAEIADFRRFQPFRKIGAGART